MKFLPYRHLPTWSQNGETAAGFEICTRLTMMTVGLSQLCRSGICIVGFEPIS